jgi:CheY-like chemotaxis protein
VRLLLVNDRRAERDLLVKALSGAKCEVEAVADDSEAIAAMTREAAQVIVVSPPVRGGDEAIRKLKSFDASGQAYFLAILDGAVSHKELTNLLAAGVNDFLRRPVLDAELIERAKAPTRLLRWVRSVARPTAFDFSAPVDFARLQAWQSLGSAVGEDLAQMVGQGFTIEHGVPAPAAAGVRAATIPMSLAEEQIEVRVSIVVDAAAADWLRANVLGDASASEAMVDDALREFANTAGGALKRAALAENVTLTTGIPFNAFVSSQGQTAFSLLLEEGNVRLFVVGAIKSKQNQRVAASKLAEGMIVVHDIRNEGGLLLVPAGSRLTSSSAAQLARVLGPRFFLEVAPAA